MMKLHTLLAGTAFLISLGGSNLIAANWPAWRGDVAGSGITTEKNLPTQWSATKNVKWRTELPDIGNSTPAIWGDRIFITQAITDEDFRGVLCFDRNTGKQLWKSGVTYAQKEQTHATNPYCASSAVTDGERVVAFYGPAGLYCYDLDGKELWKRDFGPIKHVWGWASSPVLYKNLCIHYYGPGEGAYLVAVDKKTGKTVWKFTEPKWDVSDRTDGPNPQKQKPEFVGTFGTPIVINASERDELVMSFPTQVMAFDPATGKELWHCKGLNPLAYCSPIYGDGTVIAMGSFYGNSLAIKAGGSGDVTGNRLWHKVRHDGGIGSGVVKDGHFYYHDQISTAYCYDLKTGEQIWESACDGKPKVWSSFLLSGDNIYSMNQKGETRIFKAEAEYEEVAVNDLGEKANASIAVSDGDLFIRTHEALWCIGK